MKGHEGLEDCRALEEAAEGFLCWRAALLAQRDAAADHGHFYDLGWQLVDTLRVLEEFTRVLVGQVEGYGKGRDVLDDEGADPHTRLELAAAQLRETRGLLARAERAANAYWSAISHIGTRVQP